MTAPTGLAGVQIGLITSVMICPLFIIWPDTILYLWLVGIAPSLDSGCCGRDLGDRGWFIGRAVEWICPNRTIYCLRCVGGLAGAIHFCLWGATTAESARGVLPLASPVNEPFSLIELLGAIVRQIPGIGQYRDHNSFDRRALSFLFKTSAVVQYTERAPFIKP
jgi:hypothetical protein